MLEHSDLAELLAGRKGPLWICNIPERARVALGCSSGAVYLAAERAKHILARHDDIDTFQLLLLPIAIQKGQLLREIARPRFINSVYRDGSRAFFVAMKTAAHAHELWVSSMYRISDRQIQNKLALCKVL